MLAQGLLKQCLWARETTITHNYVSKSTQMMKKEKKFNEKEVWKSFTVYDFLTTEYLLKWTQWNVFFPNKKTLNSKLNFHWE